MQFLLDYQWEIFILLEVLSLVSILLFGIVRYLLSKKKSSVLFLFLFLVLLLMEAALVVVLYRETGEISTFQIVITIFVIYACTFGIGDFKKLDRYMRLKIGNWRGIDLLTEEDKLLMRKQKDPRYIAQKYRYSSMIHFVIFVCAQAIFWYIGLGSIEKVISYLTDLSWIGTSNVENTPYPNEVLYGISQVWGLVFIIDFIYSWSYTIFPSKQGGE